MSVVSNAGAASTELDNIQAHLLRASKFSDGTTRNWSLFFFFRILPQAEFDATIRRLSAAAGTPSDGDDSPARIKNERDLWLDFAQPSFANAGIVDQSLADQGLADARVRTAPFPPDGPAQSFLDWLKVLASADKGALLRNLTRWMALDPKKAAASGGNPEEFKDLDLAKLNSWVADLHSAQRLNLQRLPQWLQFYSDRENYTALLKKMGEGLRTLTGDDSSASLAIVALYELLRQCALAMSNDSNQAKPGIIRGETELKVTTDIPADATPINIAFSYSGLAALKLDQTTLASFPDPFKQGMAARAQRLHDTGPSAPEYWEGELGLPSIHGYFTGGFATADHLPLKEAFWKAMRSDVAAFNNPIDARGDLLRFWLRLIFRALGIEILHIELGQDPYHVDDDGQIVPADRRVEHFGFRDGLSQPFVDLGLRDTAPGGGTASRKGTWTPIAPGEIFLSQPDEDNEVQCAPVSRKLTLGSTFLVFRKLEQDVAGFRAFLQRQRPDRGDQDALAAQLVGRWRDGTPLVLSPEFARAGDLEAGLNDFRYAADDPRGEKCPLQAHIRRANPRDIGGRDEVRRHRILRRGISYGGPLLKEGAQSDDEKRGLLFIAANSRIDLQFEVIQADWINGGEFLGQAGLGKCPLTGTHGGALTDSFLEANAVAPITRLPRFVVTRGGDYFFAPGIGAIKLISEGKRFEPEGGEVPFGGFTMADASTSVLFDRDRLQRYTARILASPAAAVVRVALPPSVDGTQQHIAFVGQHAHVTAVLRNNDASGQLAFSVKQYRDTARFITRGQDLLVAVDSGPTRDRLKKILNAAWLALHQGYPNLEDALRDIVRNALDMAIRRTAQARRIDLVHDLASRATYAVLCRLYGTPGPPWLTELAASLPFAHQHVGELPPDWIAALMGDRPDDQGFATMQIWSTIILADLVGNIQSQMPLHVVARQVTSEMLNHIDGLLALRRGRLREAPIEAPKTLLEAFVKIANDEAINGLYSSHGGDAQEAYYRDVSAILLELAGTSLAAIPLTLASVMGSLFKLRIDLASLLPQILSRPDGLARLIYEAERLNPNLAVRMRYCERTTTLPPDTTINQGDWVGALIVAANLDPRAFPSPHLISFDRNMQKYLLFNEYGAERQCWGRERVAMAVLEECMLSAGRLKGLRRVAGAAGEPIKLVGVAVGLPARFTHVGPKPQAPPGP